MTSENELEKLNFNDSINWLQGRRVLDRNYKERVFERKLAPVADEVLAEVLSAMQRAQFKFEGEPFTLADVLFKKGYMMGECWQTSNFLAPFFQDHDSVVRGHLHWHQNYHHGWIELERMAGDFVFDPALSILCTKQDYYDIFTPRIAGKAQVKDVSAKIMESWKNRDDNNTAPKWFKSRDTKYCYLEGCKDLTQPIFRGAYDFKLTTTDTEIGEEISEIEVKTYDFTY